MRVTTLPWRSLGIACALLLALAADAFATTLSWWDTAYGNRREVTFGVSHTALTTQFTISVTMDTQIASTNVKLATANDVRVVYQTATTDTEIDRVIWNPNTATSAVEFRLQANIAANLDRDPAGVYYIYYNNAAAGAPPATEANVYFFADFFNRADNTAVGGGWTEWTTGGGNVAISGNRLAITGNNANPADSGVKQNFPLGDLTGDFELRFDWTLPANTEATWTHYVQIGNGMLDNNRATNCGPSIFTGEGAHFVPNGTENIKARLTDAAMENSVNGGPHAIRLVVNQTAGTYDYYRASVLRAAGNAFVNTGLTLNQIRVACDNYVSTQPAFQYDNLRVILTVADAPENALGGEQVPNNNGTTIKGG